MIDPSADLTPPASSEQSSLAPGGDAPTGQGAATNGNLAADQMERVPLPRLRRHFEDYVRAVDRSLPGVLEGLYVVGSLALGDFSARFSDVDIVAVASDDWTPERLRLVTKTHHFLNRHKLPVRVAYATWSQLTGDPATATVPCYCGSKPLPQEDLANPLTWHILATKAIALRGPLHPAVLVNEAALEAWAVRQLNERWGARAKALKHHPAAWLLKRSVASSVLEVSRLFEAATTGQVLSKLDAAEEVLKQVPERYMRIIRDSTEYRRGYHTSMYWGPLERKHHAIELIAEVTSRGRPGTDATTGAQH